MSIDALIEAARMGDAALTARLIERDPELANTRDRDGWTALHMAAAEGHAAVIESVLRLGGEIDIVSYLDGTPLAWALQNGSLPPIRTLLDHGADPAKVEEFEDGCVFETASPSTVEYLLQRYPEWIRKYYWGKTLLHRLAPLGNVGKLGVLLDLGAEIDAVAEDGRTALAVVADSDRSEFRLETARFLLARGAAPDLDSALLLRMPEIAVRLLKEETAPRSRHGGMFPYKEAIACRSPEIVKLLLARAFHPAGVLQCMHTSPFLPKSPETAEILRLLEAAQSVPDHGD